MPVIDRFGDDNEKFHYKRWQECLRMFGKELLRIKDKRTVALLRKYSVAVMPGYGFGLTFPKGFKESNLPTHLRLCNEPDGCVWFAIQRKFDAEGEGFNDWLDWLKLCRD